MNKKNILTAAVSLSLVACLSIGATLAYFTDRSDVATNAFTAGKNVNITLIDEFDKTTTPKGSYVFDQSGVQTGIEYTDVMPGDMLDKDVSVMVHDGSSNAYVAVVVSVDNVKNVSEQEVYDLIDEAVARQTKALGGDSSMWQASEDVTTSDGVVGKLYMYNPQYPGWQNGVPENTTMRLFSDIEIPADWGNQYADATFNINVRAYAIQTDNLEAENLKDAIEGNLQADETTVEFEYVD